MANRLASSPSPRWAKRRRLASICLPRQRPSVRSFWSAKAVRTSQVTVAQCQPV